MARTLASKYKHENDLKKLLLNVPLIPPGAVTCGFHGGYCGSSSLGIPVWHSSVTFQIRPLANLIDCLEEKTTLKTTTLVCNVYTSRGHSSKSAFAQDSIPTINKGFCDRGHEQLYIKRVPNSKRIWHKYYSCDGSSCNFKKFGSTSRANWEYNSSFKPPRLT